MQLCKQKSKVVDGDEDVDEGSDRYRCRCRQKEISKLYTRRNEREISQSKIPTRVKANWMSDRFYQRVIIIKN